MPAKLKNGRHTLGKRLEAYRLSKDLSLQELASIIGRIHWTTIGKYENGAQPSKLKAARLERFLDRVTRASVVPLSADERLAG